MGYKLRVLGAAVDLLHCQSPDVGSRVDPKLFKLFVAALIDVAVGITGTEDDHNIRLAAHTTLDLPVQLTKGGKKNILPCLRPSSAKLPTAVCPFRSLQKMTRVGLSSSCH